MTIRIALVLGLLAQVAACDACGGREAPPSPQRDAERPRRVIEPVTDRVGQLPPYGIRAEGVGPYKLGEKLTDLLERLASGPRIVLFDIPGLVHRNVIRAEDDAILVGGEQGGTASFVAVVGSDVARTEGIHVGSTRDELTKALGPLREDLDRAHDPRLLVPATLPNARVVLDGDKVAAIVVNAAPPAPREVPATECPRPASHDGLIGTCILGGSGELMSVDGDEITLHAPDSDKALLPTLRFSGLVFAAPLRYPGEGRGELAVITRTDDSAQRTWSISVMRFENNRPPVSAVPPSTPLYQLTAVGARLIGADLHDVDLYLELTSRPDGFEVGGLLTTPSPPRSATKIRDLVVISPVPVARRRGKSAAVEATDAGAPSDATEIRDGSGGSNKSKP